VPRDSRFVSLELPAGDVAEQERFYSEVLGLEVEAGPSSVGVAAGATRLTFVSAAAESPVAHFAFNVPADGLSRAIAALDADVRWLPDNAGHTRHAFPSWKAEAVYFVDPAGHIVELIARQDAGLDDGRGMGRVRILGVSELGIVVPNVIEAARDLARLSGLAPYGRGGEQFAAIGDARGLLIVVEEGRPWFPEGETPGEPVRGRAVFEAPLAAEYVCPARRLTLEFERE